MDAQQEHDWDFSQRLKKAKKEGQPLVDVESKQRLEALLKEKRSGSSKNGPSFGLGPIAQAMENHPGLTEEKAIEMAEEFGF